MNKAFFAGATVPASRATRRARLYASAAVIAVLIAGFVVGQPSNAFAAGYPSWSDVQAARNSVAAKQAEIARLDSLINSLTGEVSAAQELANQKGAEFQVAQQKLDEAGYKPDANGVRFKLKHRPAPWGEYTQLWGEYYAQALKKIGINVELVTNDAPGFLNGVYRDHDFDTANGWHQFRADPAVSTTVWLRSGAPVGTAWSNQFGYKSDKMDGLIDAAAAELNPAKRADLYHQVQRLEMTDLPVIFAIEHPFLGITSKKLKNHHNTPRWDSSSWYDLWLDQ